MHFRDPFIITFIIYYDYFYYLETHLLLDLLFIMTTFCFIPRRPKLRYEKRMRRCTKNFNSDLFLLDTDKIISNLESNLYRDNWDPEDALNSLLNAFTALINSHLPLKVQSKKSKQIGNKTLVNKRYIKFH